MRSDPFLSNGVLDFDRLDSFVERRECIAPGKCIVRVSIISLGVVDDDGVDGTRITDHSCGGIILTIPDFIP